MRIYAVAVLIAVFSIHPTPGFSLDKPDVQSGVTLGYLSTTGGQVANFTWRPSFQFHNLGIGLEMDLPVGEGRPVGYENLVLRYLDYQGVRFGVRYGALENVTLGHGLLMKNYSNNLTGPLLHNNRQNGVRAHWDDNAWRLEGITTGTGIYAVRGEQWLDMFSLGVYVIRDTDGVTTTTGSGTTVLPSLTGYGVDATIPTMIPAVDLYAEYAQLSGFGSGLTSGVKWGYDFLIVKALARLERQQFDANFAPSLFNAEYEINPLNFAAYRAAGVAREAVVGELDLMFLNYVSAHAVYESFSGATPSARADFKVSDFFIPGYRISGYAIAPNLRSFRSLTLEQGLVYGARVGYKINSATEIIVHYKRAYNPTLGQPEDTTYYSLAIGM